MALIDFILNSPKFSLRSNLFVWDCFEVSSGIYRFESGTLYFVESNDQYHSIDYHVKNWFILDDESIIYDGGMFGETKNDFTIWKYDNHVRSGSFSSHGLPLFVQNGWVVSLDYGGSIQKLFKVAEDSKDFRIINNSGYVSRPYMNTNYHFDEVYTCNGLLNEEATREEYRFTEEFVRGELAIDAFDTAVEEETDYTDSAIISFIKQKCPIWSKFISKSQIVDAINTVKKTIYYRYCSKVKKNNTIKANVNLLTKMLANNLSSARNIIDYKQAISNPALMNLDDNFFTAIEIHKRQTDKVINTLVAFCNDCSHEDLLTVLLNEKLLNSVLYFYELIELTREAIMGAPNM